ncbi:MAG: ubiquinol-cytochrome c reductase iron-sulfur subunit [Xenococcaceae cyanobacterium]
MDRRKFLGWVGVGALASYLPVVIAACSSDDRPQAKQESPKVDKTLREDGFMVIGTIEELDRQGLILDKKAGVIVVRNPENNNLSALNPICTHQSCTVAWDADAKNLACPCHGSKFASDGKVVNGPANKPLGSYEIKQEEGLALVKVA